MTTSLRCSTHSVRTKVNQVKHSCEEFFQLIIMQGLKECGIELQPLHHPQNKTKLEDLTSSQSWLILKFFFETMQGNKSKKKRRKKKKRPIIFYSYLASKSLKVTTIGAPSPSILEASSLAS